MSNETCSSEEEMKMVEIHGEINDEDNSFLKVFCNLKKNKRLRNCLIGTVIIMITLYPSSLLYLWIRHSRRNA